ncbi:hypothetical protein HMPREF0973_00009 [Prevotella veroralis F0319]|uniref:Uncharacterized protein n=1 Tax=Prevotella veroralis F0319 TaxID=649761 RepID=C9MK92_9BACT|nr:hypothetical protein HMPREF0973_00009 [Prevotella veroralis F0319]
MNQPYSLKGDYTLFKFLAANLESTLSLLTPYSVQWFLYFQT